MSFYKPVNILQIVFIFNKHEMLHVVLMGFQHLVIQWSFFC